MHNKRFLLELGNDVAFLARKKRLRVPDESHWIACSSATGVFAALWLQI